MSLYTIENSGLFTDAIQETVPFGENFMTISAHTDRLRWDIFTAAQSRGIDDENAEKLAKNTRFIMSRQLLIEELKKQGIKKSAQVKFFETLLGQSSLRKDKFFDKVLGYADGTKEKPIIYLDPENIAAVSHAASPQNRSAAQAIATQMVYGSLRHEREHILQDIDPVARQREKNDAMFQRVTDASILGTMILTGIKSVDMLSANLSLSPELRAIGTGLVIIVPIISQDGVSQFNDALWYSFLRQSEKDARYQQKHGENLSGLFDISFEYPRW